jgi:hypothetical protein
MALDLEETEKACAAVRCSRHRRTVNSFAHLSFERPRSARGDGGSVVFDRIGGQTVRPRACDAACRADPVCRHATKLAQQRWHDACTTMSDDAGAPDRALREFERRPKIAASNVWVVRCLFQSDNEFRRSSVPELHVVRDRLLPASFRIAPGCVLN